MVIKKFVLNKNGYATVEHFDGDIRVIPPLYLGQMIWKGKDGKFRYDKEVPNNSNTQHSNGENTMAKAKAKHRS